MFVCHFGEGSIPLVFFHVIVKKQIKYIFHGLQSYRPIEKERAQLGFRTWKEEKTAARDRSTWRRRIRSPILQGRERKDDDEPIRNENYWNDSVLLTAGQYEGLSWGWGCCNTSFTYLSVCPFWTHSNRWCKTAPPDETSYRIMSTVIVL